MISPSLLFTAGVIGLMIFLLSQTITLGKKSERQDGLIKELQTAMKTAAAAHDIQIREWERRFADHSIIKQQEVTKWVNLWLNDRNRWQRTIAELARCQDHNQLLIDALKLAGGVIPVIPDYAIPLQRGESERMAIPELDEASATIEELNRLVEQHFGKRI